MSEPNYVTCPCQHCSGHIKFDANQLRRDETRRIECPHCHLETVIFHPHNGGKHSPLTEKINLATTESVNRSTNGKKPKSSRTELFLFGLVRFITLVGAFIVLIAFFVIADLAIQSWLPEKPKNPVPIPYYVVAPVQQVAQPNGYASVPNRPKMASKNAFPQIVVDFLVKHEGFSLKEWLDQLKPEDRQPFLDNLAIILQTANANNLTPGQSEQVVKDFADLWITENEKAPDPNAALEKQVIRASCVSAAFGLLLTLTIFCLILVLLAIERNTRQKD